MRVAVVDIGTNSTRLLVADVTGDGELTERERRTKVTRLGDRLGETGVLGDEAMARVLGTVREYQAVIEGQGVERAVAVLTSAVRDAANGEHFLARVRAQRGGLDARVIGGDEEARLTFRGATSERGPGDATPTTPRCRPASSATPSATWPPTRRPATSCAPSPTTSARPSRKRFHNRSAAARVPASPSRAPRRPSVR